MGCGSAESIDRDCSRRKSADAGHVAGEIPATREPNYKSHILGFEKQRQRRCRWTGDLMHNIYSKSFFIPSEAFLSHDVRTPTDALVFEVEFEVLRN